MPRAYSQDLRDHAMVCMTCALLFLAALDIAWLASRLLELQLVSPPAKTQLESLTKIFCRRQQIMNELK